MPEFKVTLTVNIDAENKELAESTFFNAVTLEDWIPKGYEVKTIESNLDKKKYTQEEVIKLLDQERRACIEICKAQIVVPPNLDIPNGHGGYSRRKTTYDCVSEISSRITNLLIEDELTKIKVVVEVEGGVIQNINANQANVEVCVVDYDTDGCDTSDYRQLPNKDIDEDLFVGTIHSPFYNPELVDKFFKVVDVEINTMGVSELDLSNLNLVERPVV